MDRRSWVIDMAAVALETEVVGSRYDKTTRTCYYTIERNGSRWTVSLPIDQFAKHKSKQLRRNYLANALTTAMRNPPDPPTGAVYDPHKPATWQEFDKLPTGAWYLNPADGKLQQK